MVLVGYHVTGAYKLFDPKKSKMFTCRDVVFEEKKGWEWNSANAKNTSAVLDNLVLIDLHNEQNNVPATDSEVQVRRSQRKGQAPQRLQVFEMFPDTAIDEDGDLLMNAFIAETELVTVEDALANKNWKAAMGEELKFIEKNKT